MKFLAALLLLLSFLASWCYAEADLHPLSEEYIAQINEKATTWKAGKNFAINDWERVKKIANGVLPSKRLHTDIGSVNPHDESEDVPEEFDAREQWSKCESLKQIRDQSSCGSCWAFAAVEAMSDRICIHSDQTQHVYVSAEDLNSCCFGESECGLGCGGGYIDAPWYYWNTDGIVTGGLYNASQGCKDYSLEPCEHHVDGAKPQCDSLDFDTPACVRSCYDTSLDYTESLTFGQGQINTFSNEKQIQLEIYKNGPVEAAFVVYDDFLSYKSGVYQATSKQRIGAHAIKIFGWGIEKGVNYWLIANSWDSDWGDNGYVKFFRGENHCGIESNVAASLPLL